ncbi:MAG: HAD family hydrolase [Thermaerobacter sp.]|nr:HAD family hydrolase [Thermaerobacter sp.]
MVDAVLFDVGNTLLHLDHLWLAEQAITLGVLVTQEDVGRVDAGVRRRLNEGLEEVPDSFAAFFARIGRRIGLSSEGAQLFGARAEGEHQRDPRGMWRCVAEGDVGTVAALRRRGISVGVISNSDGRVEEQLRLAGLRELFAVVVDSRVVGIEKPDARIFEFALQELSVAPQQALYIGDLLRADVDGARNAGMHALLLDPWDAYPEIEEGRIRRLAQILPLLGTPPMR